MLPSVETQTVKFVKEARSHVDLVQSKNLKFGGFSIYIKYKRDERSGKESLIIARVEVPLRYRGRGWFWIYLDLCNGLVPQGVEIESVVNKRLKKSLINKPNFVELVNDCFLMVG